MQVEGRAVELPPLPAPAKTYDSWMDAARQVPLGSPADDDAKSSRPRINPLDRAVLSSVEPLKSEVDCLLCPHCQRPVLRALATVHAAECIKNPLSTAAIHAATVKEEADAETLTGPSIEPTPSAASSRAETPLDERPEPRATKKRKTDADAPPRKKVKKEKPVKPVKKARPPLNVDRQCGVMLPNGQPCMRSLTCKAHSMGAKRAVVGRSVAFDVLLANYQRQNQAKNAGVAAKAAAAESEPDEPLNPEKEFQQVMEGVRRAHCVPLARKVIVPTRGRANDFRLREMLALALLPKGMSATGDTLLGRHLAYRPEQPQALHYVRAPAVQRAMYLAALQQRRK